jgi:transketolase
VGELLFAICDLPKEASMEKKKASLRKASGEALVRLGGEIDNLVVLEADIGKSTQTVVFKNAYPNRFYNVGVAEANMAGVAAGLATTGILPICSTYAVFMSMRACEPIRQSICYPNLNVKFVATHGGLSTGVDGVSHQGIEDIAIFRSLPGTCVIVPSDATMVYPAYKAAIEHSGPVYIRLIRDPVPILYNSEEQARVTLGKARIYADGTDVTLWCCGIMVSVALEAAEILARQGISARVVDSPSVKPIDKMLLEKCAQETGCVVSCEDHIINGGLGSAVAEVLGESYPVPMERIGLQDTFGESGRPDLLFEKYGMSPRHIAEAAKRVIQRKINHEDTKPQRKIPHM